MTLLAFDTSAAVPFLMRSHDAHTAARQVLAGRTAALTTLSLAETYSVLTRLPGDARVGPADAARLIEANFTEILAPEPEVSERLPAILAPHGIAGGAVYDALVALGAIAHDCPLATRDARARGTYLALGAEVEVP